MNLLDYRLNIIPINVFIDPQYPVERAIITHAHADHAKPGHKKVLGTKETLEIMKIRYGKECAKEFQSLNYGQKISIDGVSITLFPAGHIIGSSQVLLEYKNHKIVITGDYKTMKDSTSSAFELIKCDTLVTEATFGLPIFKHPNPNTEITKVLESVETNNDTNHLIGVYALGKAQRIIKLLRENGFQDTIFIHGALKKICDYYQSTGINLGKLQTVTKDISSYKQKIILAPPSALKDRWSRKFRNKILSQASGWMNIKQRVKQSLIEIPLVISDHSDWNELTKTISECGAENIWVTHGREEGLVHWCKTIGLNAKPLSLKGREEEY